MDHYTRSLHIFLSDSQHKQLRRIARVQGEQMTKVARSAIVSYMNSFEEEEKTEKAKRDHEERGRDRRKPSGLGISFDPKPTSPPSSTAPTLPTMPLGMIGSFTPDLKPLVEHIKKAASPEEKERRLATVTETIRSVCEAKEAEAIVRKLKAESESGNGISHLLGSIFGTNK